ncbi:MAG: hypothetical protein RLY58_1647 [Pseudomonadota bacterium]|jgi:hypothetical protein
MIDKAIAAAYILGSENKLFFSFRPPAARPAGSKGPIGHLRPDPI